MEKIVDLVIVGAGPAGLAASIYASRYGAENIVIGNILGGQISGTHLIDNYPGIEDVSGFDFGQKLAQHAKKYGAEIKAGKVTAIFKRDQQFDIELEGGQVIKGQAVLLATGTKHRKLEIPGEAEFCGKGVSYCATCDGFFYKNKIVAVVGGSDSAASAAVYLSGIAKEVYLIYRRDKLRAELYWQKIISEKENIKIIYNTNLAEVCGSGKLSSLKLDKAYNGKETLDVDGLFIEVGAEPNIDFAKDLKVDLDKDGYVKINAEGATSVAGVWAAGDITDGSDKFRQVITAAAEGAIAARNIHQFLQKTKKK